jgi:hypothetical protein
VAGRDPWSRLLELVIVCLAAAAALTALAGCGHDQGSGATAAQEAQSQDQGQPEADQSESEPAEQVVRERELRVTSEDVGAHLEEKSYAAGLPSWLEASEDRTLSSLPGRALASSGIAFSPSDDSPTEETLWLHVFTDQSKEAATEWVKYVASQPPQLAGVIVPHHELFDASFLPAPLVGDASVAVELFRGHSGICVRSTLLVFAQERVLVFLFNSIEITRDVVDSARTNAGGGLPAHCDAQAVAGRLTDIDAIAHLISGRLSADP